MSRDQASSFPARHSLTRSVSFEATACFFPVCELAGLIEWHLPHHSRDRAVPRSKEHKVPARLAESCRPTSWLPLEYPGWPEKSWVDIPGGFPARGRKGFFVVRTFEHTFVR